MPYPRKLLNDHETIALDLHPHWWSFSEPAGALVGAIVVGIVSFFVPDSVQRVLGVIALIGIVVSAIWLAIRYLKWATTNFVITSDRIIFRQGVIAKSGIEIPLERVNNVLFNQSIFERMLGAGDLLIESGGETGQQRFTDVRQPERVKNMIHAQKEQNEMRKGSYSGGGGAADVASQLEKLEGLLSRGTISPEEFESQKRKLLG